MKPTSKLGEQAARDNAEAIHAFWSKGADSLKCLPPERLHYGKKATLYRQEARRLGLNNIDTLTKMRRVAQEFTHEQIQHLTALVLKHRSCFGPSNLQLLLRVADRKKRQQLGHEAIRQRWPSSRLERVIQQMQGGRRRWGGRLPAVPEQSGECLLKLGRVAHQFVRWCQQALPGLADSLHPVVRKALRAVQAVHQAAEQEYERFRDPVR